MKSIRIESIKSNRFGLVWLDGTQSLWNQNSILNAHQTGESFIRNLFSLSSLNFFFPLILMRKKNSHSF